MSRHRKRFALRPLQITLAIAGIAFVAALNLTPIHTSDFWIQLKVGDIIRQSGSIPRTILFAATEARDFPFMAHEWLPSLINSLLFDVVGYEGMIVFKCLLALAIFGLVVLLSWRIHPDLTMAVFIGSMVLLAINFRTHMRPEIYAFVCFLLMLVLLDHFRRRETVAPLLGLLPVAVLWANSHGSVQLALLLPPLFLLGGIIDDLREGRLADAASRARRLRRSYLPLAGASGAVVLCCLANPRGFHLLEFAFRFSRAGFVREHIVEFAPTFDERIRAFLYWKIYVVYAAIVVLSFVLGRKRIHATSVLMLLLFGYLSVDAIRFTAWFAVAGAYVLAYHLGGRPSGPAARRTFAIALLLALVAGTLTVAEKGNVRGFPVGFRNMAPLSPKALEFLEEAGLEGNVFNSFKLGDPLIYHFYPRARVTIDSRVDAYGEAYYVRYRTLSGRSLKLLGPADDLIEFLDRYRMETIVSRPFDFNNWTVRDHYAGLQAAGWRMTFADESAVVLQRTPGQGSR